MVAANTNKTTNRHTSNGTGDESHSPDQSHTDHVAPDVSAVVSLPTLIGRFAVLCFASFMLFYDEAGDKPFWGLVIGYILGVSSAD